MRGNGKDPLISIIMPTYNRAHLLPRAITSVLSQTFTNFELIVVDDGSKDETSAVVESFASPRVRYLRHNKNSGPSSARNTGIKASKGDYIAFLDSDDEWGLSKLHEQVAIFDRVSAEVGVIYSGFFCKNKHSRKMKQFCLNLRGNIHETILVHNPGLNTSSALLKKECFQHCGLFDESLPACEDWDLFIRISEKYHFYPIKKPLVTIYREDSRLSTDYKRVAEAHQLILEKHFDKMRKIPKALAHHYRLLGLNLLYCNKSKESRSFLKKSITAYPYNIKNYMFLMLTFCPQELVDTVKALPK